MIQPLCFSLIPCVRLSTRWPPPEAGCVVALEPLGLAKPPCQPPTYCGRDVASQPAPPPAVPADVFSLQRLVFLRSPPGKSFLLGHRLAE